MLTALVGCTSPEADTGASTCAEFEALSSEEAAQRADELLEGPAALPSFSETGVELVDKVALLGAACAELGPETLLFRAANEARPEEPSCTDYLELDDATRAAWSEAIYLVLDSEGTRTQPADATERPAALASVCSHLLPDEPNVGASAAALWLHNRAIAAPEIYAAIVDGPPAIYRMTWHTENQAGYTVSNVIEFGDVRTGPKQGASPHPGTACGYDPTTDGYIVAELQRTNTSGSFDYPANFTFVIQAAGGGGPIIPAVAFPFSSGMQCVADPVVVMGSSVLAAGDTERAQFFIVLRDYLSPEHPDGFAEGLGGFQLYGMGSIVESDFQTTTSAQHLLLNGQPY